MHPRDILARAQADGVRLLRFLYCDNANVIRGKGVYAGALADFLTSGVGLTVAMQGFTLTERIAPGSALGATGEIRLRPDPDTYTALPFAPGQGQVLCDMVTATGDLWPPYPRTFLKAVIERAAAAGFEARAAFEYEFYLAREAEGGRLLPADDSLCFSTDGMNRAAPVIMEVLAALDAQGLAPQQYYPELGPAQQELTILHGPLLPAADRQIAVRETVRGVARRHGLVAVFAPKPFPDQAGSGCHVHLSLWRGERNLLHDPQGEAGISRQGRHFIAGILAHAPGLLAVTCPSVNSYQRLAPNMWSSAYTCWGPDNREATVRVASPFRGREEASTNVEIKAVDGSANPYLALGAIVTAGLDGLERGLDPGAPLTENPHDLPPPERQRRGIRRYPTSLEAAVAALEGDRVLLDALGPDLAREFVAVRKAEWADFGALPPEQVAAAHLARY